MNGKTMVLAAGLALAASAFAEVKPLAAREAADDTDVVLVPLDYAFETSFRASVPDKDGLVNTRDGVHFRAKGSQVAAEAMLDAWKMK